MKVMSVKFLLSIFLFLVSINSIYAEENDVVSIFQNAVNSFLSLDSNASIGVSFILLTILFSVIFKQGTARMLPNHSRGAMAVSIILAIFVSIGILAELRSDGIENYVGYIGKSLAFPLLLFALFAGSWAVMRGISNAQVGWFFKLLLTIGYLVLFSIALIQILNFGIGTAVGANDIETCKEDQNPETDNCNNLEDSNSFWGVLYSIVVFILIIATIVFFGLLFVALFLIREIFDLFDDDDDSSLARSRKKRKEQKEKEAQLLENLEQLKKSFHNMRTAFDDKENVLKKITQMQPVVDHLNSESENRSPTGRASDL